MNDKLRVCQPHWGKHYPDRREFKWTTVDGERIPTFQFINGNGGYYVTLTANGYHKEGIETWHNALMLLVSIAANDFNDDIGITDGEKMIEAERWVYLECRKYHLPIDGRTISGTLREVYELSYTNARNQYITRGKDNG